MKYLELILMTVLLCFTLYEQCYGDGTTYVRWGRTTCPKQTTLVYKGFAGGAAYNQAGSGANYLCLPKKPQFKPNKSPGPHYAYVMGAQYNYASPPAIHMNTVPCAVCKTKKSTTVFMLPARYECYDDWRTEYTGWLASSYYGGEEKSPNIHRAEYVCVDSKAENADDPETLKATRFYPVQSICGALPCDKYPDGKDMSCAVCSS